MVSRLARIPLEFSPGTAWNYSVATDVLGYLIEVISGQPLDQFLQQQIFEPLGMTDTGFSIGPDDAPRFINDSIVRTLAGVPQVARPLFLKIPYFGPAAMESLVSYDSSLVVGILGGSAGTTRDAFQMLSDAKKYGARVALFGRKIYFSEDSVTMVRAMRRVIEEDVSSEEATKAFHADLAGLGISPKRSLEDDLELTDSLLKTHMG